MRRIAPGFRRNLAQHSTLIALAAAVVAPTGDAAADDRNLIRGATDAPYIFALFDTSGSMASPTSYADNDCDTLGGADAPDSRVAPAFRSRTTWPRVATQRRLPSSHGTRSSTPSARPSVARRSKKSRTWWRSSGCAAATIRS